jgi:hypothetical protein
MHSSDPTHECFELTNFDYDDRTTLPEIMINGRKHYPAMSPGSAMFTVWGYYYEFAFRRLKPLPYSDQFLGVSGEMPVVTIVVVCYLPQFLIAAVGALLTRSVVRRWEQGNWW